MLEERNEGGGDRHELRGVDVHVVDLLGRHRHDLVAAACPRQDLIVQELAALRVEGRVRLGDGDRALLARLGRDHGSLFFGGVEVDDLLGDLALDHPAVGRPDESELVDRRKRGERAHQADVRALWRLDRAHAAVVGGVHVAHLDRRALAGKAAGAERTEAAAMGEARQRVGLVHELRELRRAEELLEGGDHRPDIDERSRHDGVGILGRQALLDHALHAREANAEAVLHELADGAQAAVAEVLVLVELGGDVLAARADQVHGGVGVVFGVVGHAQLGRQRDKAADELDDVHGGEHAHVARGTLLGGNVTVQTRVQLVTPDTRKVVALGIEEQPAQHGARRVEGRRLTGALLAEELDQRLLLRGRGVAVERVLDIGGLVEKLEDVVVAAAAHGAQQDGDRKLALAVDAYVDGALLVDLELEPRAALRHEVGDQHLLLALCLLGLHDVGARRTDELRDHDALGAVDDEGATLGHHGKVAHEDVLLTDLAGLLVDEAHHHGEWRREGHVLVAAFRDGLRGLTELILAELDKQLLGVVTDGRDVFDGLLEAILEEPLPRRLLDVDQIGNRQRLVQLGKGRARARTLRLVQVETPLDRLEQRTASRREAGLRLNATDGTTA